MNLIKKIYTCTFNPAIDHFIQLDELTDKEVNRSKHNEIMANGKGINVSYVLNKLGVETTVLGFNGGFSGRYIKDTLDSLDVKNNFIWVKELTRINIFLNTGKDNIKILNNGFTIKLEDVDKMIAKIRSIESQSLIIFSGSIPKGAEGILIKVSKICKEKNIEFICDTSDADLKEILKYNPLLIKPNDEEIEEVFGLKIKNEEDIIMAGNKIKKMGAKNVAITLGDKGSYLFWNEEIYFASTLKIKLVNSACAGDTFLGQFIESAIVKNDNVEMALKKANIAGSLTASVSMIGDVEKVNDYIEEIEIKKLGGK